MLKSLFSGVSGLQAHQVAMDVEANNIANVNTVGYKYSRANFSDLLAQTNQIATAPQGQLGGKNAVQVGLGTTVASVTRIFSQGSIQNSDKNTDVAIQGDGFFIVSGDGGNSYKYTRSGDFKFDGGGNFVDNNGFIAQGWLRDEATGVVDSTAPIVSIEIPPGLTTPANATENLTLKANLNSGSIIQNSAATYSIASNGDITLPSGREILTTDTDYTTYVEDVGVMFNETGEALSLQAGQGIWASFVPSTITAGAAVPAGDGQTLDITFTLDDGSTLQVTSPATPVTVPAQSSVQNAQAFAASINAQTSITGIRANGTTGTLVLTNTNADGNASHNINVSAAGAADDSGITIGAASVDTTAYEYNYSTTGPLTGAGGDKQFTSMEDLRIALQNQAQADIAGTPNVTVNEQGQFELSNVNGTAAIDLKVTKNTNGPTENIRFTQIMESMNATLPAGTTGKALSQSFNAAIHASSIDIFDSLGSKHTLRMEFRKTALDATTGSTWALNISVPEPATIDTIAPLNERQGSVRFNNDGSLATYSPPSVSFTGNNGSSPDQQVRFDFGTSNAFDGLTSFDAPSSTSGISQDGFTGGDLLGIRIDQSGTLVGSFSNGRSFGLAQIGMAKFANNEGLTADGGNVYIQSANSGNPIIGEAATAGRGFIQSSALEASNVDLSRSLTQLIIIQRGYQANGKTITTSDQLLNTLINLKN
ncbi:flagellar hook protein FlgE [Sulfurimonas sp. MAG313]|nr:flagellar hook protein FlgE [Sulfurimonas sp. MAG313]MDF1880843.1 flagellar hook protein FlgE [Sulfurimonas sp. MAG313]